MKIVAGMFPKYLVRSTSSFSLFETVIAIGILAVVLLEVNGIQGSVVYSLEYSQRTSQAVWIARGLMAKIEYEWDSRAFSEISVETSEQKLSPELWGAKVAEAFAEFTYKITISEWELPIVEFLTGGADNGEDDQQQSDLGENTNLIASQIEQLFPDGILKIAKVEVFWPDGARKSAIDLSLLLTNQRAVDKQISLISEPKGKPKNTNQQKNPNPNSNQQTSTKDFSSSQTTQDPSSQDSDSSQSEAIDDLDSQQSISDPNATSQGQ